MTLGSDLPESVLREAVNASMMQFPGFETQTNIAARVEKASERLKAFSAEEAQAIIDKADELKEFNKTI